MPKSRKQPSIDEIIYGKGYIIEEGYNPLKKKKIKIYNTSPEQKKKIKADLCDQAPLLMWNTSPI